MGLEYNDQPFAGVIFTESRNKNTLSVPVVFQHALSWIEIQVKGGTGALMGGNRTWRATKVEFRAVDCKGDFTYTGTETDPAKKAVWSVKSQAAPLSSVVVYQDNDGQLLTADDEVIENVPAGTLLIPQAAKKLYVTIEYHSPAGDPIAEVVEVDIPKHTKAWEAGKKYTYQLTFSPQEILVAPTVQTWPSSVDNTQTL